MRPLICPQCGGQIDEYPAGATFATCEYCSTKFLIEENKAPRIPPAPVEPPELDVGDPTAPLMKVLGGVIAAILIVGFIALISTKSNRTTGYTSLYSPGKSSPTPTPTPDNAILRFGGQGMDNGQFDDASSVAVDKQGRIYVADNKLRVQQFDENVQFIKLLNVPSKGRNYDRAHSIHKIEVGDDGRLFVAAGGVILVYTENWSATPRVVQVAPDYAQDLDLRSDGSMIAVSEDDEIESLLFVNKNGGITRRVRGFHTDALNAAISPLPNAAASVRVAVDAAGNIFSIYALGSLGSYSLSYNNADLAIARFTPSGKFVKSFAPTINAVGLAFDAKNRLYVAKRDSITLYDEDGNVVGSFTPHGEMEAFAVDKDGYIYTVESNTIAKYPAVP